MLSPFTPRKAFFVLMHLCCRQGLCKKQKCADAFINEWGNLVGDSKKCHMLQKCLKFEDVTSRWTDKKKLCICIFIHLCIWILVVLHFLPIAFTSPCDSRLSAWMVQLQFLAHSQTFLFWEGYVKCTLTNNATKHSGFAIKNNQPNQLWRRLHSFDTFSCC